MLMVKVFMLPYPIGHILDEPLVVIVNACLVTKSFKAYIIMKFRESIVPIYETK